eukprot:GHVS01019118.1.p1 GENE.GHVS01019118.1~~GHVS01019118.1.p1  ORF type:complete len:739 (+),score=132.79 GHVS01019118.1:277-2217(+)
MAERSRLFLSRLLSASPSVVLITHASVIEALVSGLLPGTRFARGIDLCSVTELRLQRDQTSGAVVSTAAVRTADADFVKCKAEYELGTSGFRFAKKPFPPIALIGDLCAPEVDLYEERVVALPVEALGEEEAAEEGEEGVSPRGTNRLKGQVTELTKKVKMDPKRRAFVALADDSGRLPVEKAVYLAHYYGLAPSRQDISNLESAGGGAAADYASFLKFLKDVQHPEDNAEALAEFFAPFDTNHTGVVSRVTFENFLSVYGDKLKQNEIDSICEQYHVDAKHVNYKAFITGVLTSPALPELQLGQEYEELGKRVKAREKNSEKNREKQTDTVYVQQTVAATNLDPMLQAFTRDGTSRKDKISIETAAKKAQKLGVSITPKDLGDFRSSCLADRLDLNYAEFVQMVKFVEERHNAFEGAAGSDKLLSTAAAAELAQSSFGLKQKPVSQDIKQFSVKSGNKLTYDEFIRFCEFAEQRQMAFAALSVGSPGGQSQIPAEKAGLLANKFGFAPAVQDIHRYQKTCGESMSYGEFMQFLDECQHKEDSDVDSMEAFFKPYDPTGSGYVSQKVFRNLLFMFGETYTAEQIDVIVSDICGNSDPVNYLSFINKVLTTPTDDMAVNPLLELNSFASQRFPSQRLPSSKQEPVAG